MTKKKKGEPKEEPDAKEEVPIKEESEEEAEIPVTFSNSPAFNFVLDKILLRDDNSDLKRALVAAGYRDMGSILWMCDSDLDELYVPPSRSSGNSTTLLRPDKSLITIFQQCMKKAFCLCAFCKSVMQPLSTCCTQSIKSLVNKKSVVG